MYNISSKDKDLYDNGLLSLDGILHAYKKQDPRLAEYVVKLAIIDPAPVITKGNKEDSLECDFSYHDFRQKYHLDAIDSDILQQVTPKVPITSKSVRKDIRTKRAQLFSDRYAYFIRNSSVVPERLKLGEFIIHLYEDQSNYAQDQLLHILQYVPLKWGPWQAFKYIAKRVLLDQKWIAFAVIYDRWKKLRPYITTQRHSRSKIRDGVFPVDIQLFNWNNSSYVQERTTANDITTETHIYMTRHLEKLREIHFDTLDSKSIQNIATTVFTWASSFNSSDFWYSWSQEYFWRSTGVEEDLLQLLTTANSRDIRNWAFDVVERHHRNVLENLPPEWIVQQANDPFANTKIKKVIKTWILQWTQIERSEFFAYGLHQVVLKFVDSNDRQLEDYACTFIRDFIFTRSEEMIHFITLDKVLWFLRSQKDHFHYLGLYLLFPEGEKSEGKKSEGEITSPFIDQLDFTFWTDLLGDKRLHDRAVERIRKGYSKTKITEEWLRQRLFSKQSKISTLAKDWIEEGYHDPKIDFFNLFYELIFATGISNTLQDFAWERISLRDAEEKSMLDRFNIDDYRNLFFHSRSHFRSFVIEAYKNRQFGNELFPIEMSKWLINQSDYKFFLATEELRTKYLTSSNYPNSLPSDISSFISQRIQDELELDISQLGYMWVFERSQDRATSYSFLRKVFNRQFPVSVLHIAMEKFDWRTDEEKQIRVAQKETQILQFLQSNPSEEDQVEESKKTLEYIFSIINEEMDQGSDVARRWRKYILLHLPSDNQDPDFKTEVFFPDDTFTKEWFFTTLAPLRSEDTQRINFAIDIASNYINRWSKVPGFGFSQLKPLLFHHFEEVQQFILRCIESPLSVRESIDLNDPAFIPEELHEFCFDPDQKVRQYGMKLIKAFPERFGQPDKLIQLSHSSDPVIRNMVVEIIWLIANIPQVTSNWQPTVESVLPQKGKPDSRKYIRPRKLNPPKAHSEAYPKTKFLGEGTAKNSTVHLTNYDQLEDFMKRQFFRLPSNPPSRKKKNEQPSAKQPNDQKISSGESKRLLILSMKNLALQDKEFAKVSVPIFQELVQYKMKEIREAAIAALVQIDDVHKLQIL